MTFEQLLGETLQAANDYDPSPDLFAKVQRSITEDQAYRRRLRRWLLGVGAGLVLVGVYLLATVRIGAAVTMSFTALEVLVTAMMVVVVIIVGPAIRRFGETYERDIFASSPDTGRHVLRLLDVAYYLVFGAFTLMTLVYTPPADAPDLVDWLGYEVARLGGLLMLMGVLHVVLLVALPVVGLVFGANQRRARIADGVEPSDPLADKIDRGVTAATWIVAGFLLLQAVVGTLVLLAALGAGG